MKFCDVCDNMLYVSTDGDDNLKMYCRNCNFSRVILKDGGLLMSEKLAAHASKEDVDENCIHKVNYAGDTRGYMQYITPNIKYDKTLPRVNNIPCPNKCEKKEVTYIKYDHVNMRYLYYCCACEKFWTRDS